MLSAFNLKPGVTKKHFSEALDQFVAHMQNINLLDSVGPLCERDFDTPMDTDERTQRYFFLSYFADKAQCDQSYQYILENQGFKHPTHAAVHTQICDATFLCYTELESTVHY